MIDLPSLTSIVDPRKEPMRWGPVPGKLFYVSEFSEAGFQHFPKAFPGHAWPNVVILMREGRFLWVNELEAIRRNGRKVFTDWILLSEKRESLYQSWKQDAARLMEYERGLDGERLSKMSNIEFAVTWDTFYRLAIQFWVPTIPAELGNYGSDRLLEEELRPFVPASDMISVLEVLTAPEQRSFYQDEEIDLAETDDLETHRQNYFWLKNSYASVEELPIEFFAERKDALPKDFRAQTEKRFAEVRQRKQQAIGRYQIPQPIVHIADALRIAIEWQDERKGMIFKTLHYKDLLLRHAAERFGYDYATLLDFDYREVRRSFFDRAGIEEIKNRHLGCLLTQAQQPDGLFKEDLRTLLPEDIEAAWNVFTHENVTAEQTEFKGIVACVGEGVPVRGHVKILLNPNQSAEFQPGDVLVTTMTTPEYVFVMKKSLAILTDTGGLTSHAAIVSRELKKPCIIGTKIATKILKDGDEVEVDAAKGMIRILKRAS